MHPFWTVPETTGCPGPRAAHSCDVVDAKLIVFGGWNGKKALNDLHVLNVHTHAWTECSDACAPAARNNHTTAVVDSLLFVHGGHDGANPCHDMHVLEVPPASFNRPFEQPQWQKPTTSGQQPSARACHTLTRLGRKLYMYGGYDGAKCFNDIDVLDLDTMTWIQPNVSGALPQARNAHTMTVVGAKIILFGGHSGNKHLTDMHVFETTKLLWSQPEILGAPPPGLRGHTANLIGHKIFLFGGYDGKGRSNDLYILDTAELKWLHPTECENAPAGRQRHSAALVGSKQLYIFGGFDGNRWLSDLHVLDVGRLEENALSDVAVQSLIHNMRSLLNDPEFSDVQLVVDGTPIHAHKAILAAQSEHFRAMFSGGMRETYASEVQIHGWSRDAFMAMLEFLYTGRTPKDLPHAQTVEVLGLADHYTLEGLKHLCENQLIHSVEVDSVSHILRQADRYQAYELKQYCLGFILKNFDQVARTPGFDELSSAPGLLLEVTRALAVRRAQ